MSIARMLLEEEQEYLDALNKCEEDGCAVYTVDYDGENEEQFDNFKEAKSYAESLGLKVIKVDSFTICYGSYCDGEYDDYNAALLDLDGEVIEFLED